MRIAFLDPIGWDYDPRTPLARPLGGIQSAVAYLSAELARRGHEVALFNAADAERHVDGVTIGPLGRVAIDRLAGRDAVVVVSGLPIDALRQLWPLARTGTPLLLWNQSDTINEVTRLLADRRVLASYDRILPASRWHGGVLVDEMAVPAARLHPMGNALAPAFAAMTTPGHDAPRDARPSLAYTPTPFRGLDLLLDLWPLVHARRPDATLRVFSGMAVYQMGGAADPYRALYDRARATPGVDYVGPLPQPELARALGGCWLFAYPSTYRETYCTSLIEAMAAGAHAVVTDLGALPETAAGHATLVPFATDRADLGRRFADALAMAIDRIDRDPASAAIARAAQRVHLAANATWTRRAEEWEALVAGLRRPAPPVAMVGSERVARVAPGRLRVAGRHGALIVDESDAIGRMIAKYGQWAEAELRGLLALLAPGDQVIEVGAHVGAMTVALAKRVGPAGRLFAFEPQPRMFGLLAANLAANGLDHVRAINALVGATEGWRALPPVPTGPANLGAVSFVGQPTVAAGPDAVPQVTLDGWGAGLDRLRLIKIDVEGMEAEVLAGARGLVRRLRPVIQAECTTAAGFDALAAFADAEGYDLHWHGHPGFDPDNHFGDRENPLGAMGDLNLLMLSRDRGERANLPPAFAFEDAGRLFPGLLGAGAWPSSAPPALPPAILGELVARGPGRDAATTDGDFARFHAATEGVRFLRQHRDLIEAGGYGFGERAFHAMWLELLRALPADRPVALAEIGVFKGQVISLWALTLRLLRRAVAIDAIGPLTGEGPTEPMAQAEAMRLGVGNIVPPDDYPARIAELFRLCATDMAPVRFLRGASQDPAVLARCGDAYDLVYIDGDHAEDAVRADVANFAPRVRQGGFLVLDDAALDLPGSFWKGFAGPTRAVADLPAHGFREILAVGHNRAFQRG